MTGVQTCALQICHRHGHKGGCHGQRRPGRDRHRAPRHREAGHRQPKADGADSPEFLHPRLRFAHDLDHLRARSRGTDSLFHGAFDPILQRKDLTPTIGINKES